MRMRPPVAAAPVSGPQAGQRVGSHGLAATDASSSARDAPIVPRLGDRGRRPAIPAPHRPGDAIAHVLRAAHERHILATCIRTAKAAKDIRQETGLSLASVYRHVGRLVEAGVLVVERSAFTPEGKRYDLYRSILRAATIEIDEEGERVSWQLNDGIDGAVSPRGPVRSVQR